ncbi:dsRNA-specific ribonuclease [Sphingomonas sp. PvP018]|nr:dsRNA-specific ribonuclease [Sphingomonas sp. PvP018]
MSIGMRAYITPWRTELLAELAAAESDVLLVCPYIKSTVIRSIRGILRPNVRVRTLSRFVEREFRMGSSDLEAHYWLSGHDGSIDFDLRRLDHVHAKVFVIDGRVAFVGSSNLTISGLLRNFESTVRIEDLESVRLVADQMEALWDRCAPVTAAQIGDMAQLLRRPAPIPVEREEEHVYPVVAGAAFAAEAEAKPSDFADLQQALAEPVTANDVELAAVPLVLASDASAGQAEPSFSKIEHAARLVEEFQSALLSRFGGLVAPHFLALSLAVRSDYLPSLAAKTEALGNRTFDVASFFSTSLDAMEIVGRQAYELACLSTAMRSGLLSAYGISAAEMFFREAEKPEHLFRHWDRALLGPVPSLEPVASRGERLQAIRRLHGLMVKHAGLEAALAMIEDGFNALDAVAADIDDVLAVRDPKSTLQEILALRGSRPPVYADHVQTGADHNPIWTCMVKAAKFSVEGSGAKRSEAEMHAARRCLRAMEADANWAPHVDNWRQAFFDRARRDRPVPLYPRVRLDADTAIEIGLAAAQALPLAVAPNMVAVAVTDPEARLLARAIDADNRTLAAVGARLIQIILALEMDAGRMPDHRAGVVAVGELGRLLDLGALRQAARITAEPTGRQIIEGVQALVAAMFLGNGFEPLRDWLGARLVEAAQPRGAGMPTHHNLRIWLQDNCAVYVPGAIYTSALQNLQHILDVEEPVYIDNKSGPGHAPVFTVRASWQGLHGSGQGPNRKAARQQAAFDLLRMMVEKGIDWPARA